MKRIFVSFFIFLLVIPLTPMEDASALKYLDISTAVEIDVNKSIESTIENHEAHIYKIKIPKRGYLSITSDKSNEHLEVELYTNIAATKEFAPITFRTEDNPNTTITKRIGLNKNKVVYLKVKNSRSIEKNPFKLKLKFMQTNTFEIEDNENFTTATTISANSTTKGTLNNTNSVFGTDHDYFKSKLTSDGRVKIAIKNKGQVRSIEVFNRDKEYVAAFKTDPYKSGSSSVSIGLKKGTYYIHITSYNQSEVEDFYELKTSFTKGNYYEKEKNDSTSTATPIKINKTYTGFITPAISGDDTDVYKVVISKAGTYKLSFSKKDKYVEATIQSPSISVWKKITTDPTSSYKRSTSVKLKKGFYFIHINTYTGGHSPSYSIKLSK